MITNVYIYVLQTHRIVRSLGCPQSVLLPERHNKYFILSADCWK